MIVRSTRGPRMRNGQCSSTTMGVSTMSDYERNVTTAPFGQAIGRASSVAVDEGLRAYMLRIYNYMVLGLAITGAAALGIYMLSVTGEMSAAAKVMKNGAEIPARIGGNLFLTPIGYYFFASPLRWVIMLTPLAMVFLLSFGVERMRPAVAQVTFWIFLASVVNLFMASSSSALQFAISVIGVLVFAGLTAWDTQRLKTEYLYGAMDGETAERSAIIGALSLYLNFINLFTLLLQLLGQRDE